MNANLIYNHKLQVPLIGGWIQSVIPVYLAPVSRPVGRL
jgi:hypothetical protein